MQEIEDLIDGNDMKVYASYYWMYIMSFTFFCVFMAVTVNILQQLPRELYYQQKYW